MPIINEYPSTNAGQAFMPEMLCPDGSMPWSNAMPAVINMGGSAVTGYALRYTNICELNALYGICDDTEAADCFFHQGCGFSHSRPPIMPFMNP